MEAVLPDFGGDGTPMPRKARLWSPAASLATAVLVAAVVLTSAEAPLLPREPADVPPTAAGPATSATSASPPSTFVAQWSSPATGKQPVLAVFSSTTGELLGRLGNLPGWPATISGPIADAETGLWYSVSTGPRVRSDVAGGDPAPDSCHSAIRRWNPTTRQPSTVLRAGPRTLIGGVAPSRDGTELAYLAEPCTGYFDWHIVVRDLRTGATHTLAADALDCHNTSLPSWSPGGSQLAFAWGPSPLAPGDHAPAPGTCVPPLPGALAVVPVTQRAAPTGAELHPATPGCGYVTAAYDAWGIVAIETCGSSGLGVARLVQWSQGLSPVLQLSVPARADGVSLAADPTGTSVLVTEYQAPATNPPTSGKYWVEVFDGQQLHAVVTTSTDSISSATWW